MGIVAVALKALRAEEITAKEAPHLIAAVEKMAAKAGIKAPRLHMAHTPLLAGTPNAGALGRSDVVITPRMLEVMESTLEGPPSEELLAVLGHEMFHNKHAIYNIATTRLSPILAPAAAMTGLHYYEKAQRRVKDKKDKEAIHHAIEEVVAEDREDLRQAKMKHLDEEMAKHLKHHGNAFITAAKYAAVAAAGLGGGLYASRQFSRAFEFAADAHGAKMVSAEAMGSALRKLHAAQNELMEMITQFTGKPYKQPWILKFMNETIIAHPSEAERLAKLGISR